jgi:uncharacterized protein (UPF0333 family)
MNNQKWLLIIILIVVIAVGAYLIGKSSNNQVPTPSVVSNSQTENTPSPTTTEQTPTTVNQNLVSEGTNGLNCKAFADQVATLDQSKSNGQVFSVLQSHYSQSLNQCYYELSISDPIADSLSTDIRSAPNDDWIAECSTGVYPPPQLFCTEHNVSRITQQQFQQLETKYLTN